MKGGARYDEPIARYWPAFAAQGKESITIRQALCHEAGLYRMSEMVQHPSEMLDWQHMLERVAAARPAHMLGRAHGYHAITYGWLAGGIAEAIGGADLDTLLETRLREPLGLTGSTSACPMLRSLRVRDSFTTTVFPMPCIRRPVNSAFAFERVLRLVGVDLAELRAGLMPFTEPFDWNVEATVQARIPAANGQFTARALARASTRCSRKAAASMACACCRVSACARWARRRIGAVIVCFRRPCTGGSAITAYSASARTHRSLRALRVRRVRRVLRSDASPVSGAHRSIRGWELRSGTCASFVSRRMRFEPWTD